VKLSHLDEAGRARMVDVGDKPESARTATAEGIVRMSREAFEQVAAHAIAKGDVLAVAEVAGVMAAKRTGELIPLCHPLPLDVVTVEARLVPELPGVAVAREAAYGNVNPQVLLAVLGEELAEVL
jgi:cyclic pyranopterin phosphate synthase